jgi:F420-dependent oxidoreductase-like protein
MIMAQQALTTQVVCCGRFTLGIGPSHHWIVNSQLGLPYDRPARLMGDYLDVLGAAFAGPGTVDVDNENYCVHSPVDVTDGFGMPVLLSALGPTMLQLAGERSGGTILWMADERAIGDHVVPRITAAADRAGRPAPRIVAGVPVALCSNNETDDARGYASEVLGHADFSPNYVRLLQHGDAQDVGRPGSAEPVSRRGRDRPGGANHPVGQGHQRANRIPTSNSGVPVVPVSKFVSAEISATAVLGRAGR